MILWSSVAICAPEALALPLLTVLPLDIPASVCSLDDPPLTCKPWTSVLSQPCSALSSHTFPLTVSWKVFSIPLREKTNSLVLLFYLFQKWFNFLLSYLTFMSIWGKRQFGGGAGRLYMWARLYQGFLWPSWIDKPDDLFRGSDFPVVESIPEVLERAWDWRIQFFFMSVSNTTSSKQLLLDKVCPCCPNCSFTSLYPHPSSLFVASYYDCQRERELCATL